MTTRNRLIAQSLGQVISNNNLSEDGQVLSTAATTVYGSEYTAATDLSGISDSSGFADGSLHYLSKIRKLYVWDDSDGSFYNITLDSNELGYVEPGGALFRTTGLHTWTAPAGVTSVSVVAVGSGSGYRAAGDPLAGSGGGLGWKNNISVTPGQTYTVKVGEGGGAGATGQESYFKDSSTVVGFGGSNGGGGSGGSYVGDGGGDGGKGASSGSTLASVGGGGAAGYSGNGGDGAGVASGSGFVYSTGNSGSGGGGAGAGSLYQSHGGYARWGRGGGGVGVWGEGTSGTGVHWNTGGGPGGSGGTAGSAEASGGLYGGGMGKGRNVDHSGKTAGNGAVRIVWGEGRSFPSTNVDSSYSTAGETIY